MDYKNRIICSISAKSILSSNADEEMIPNPDNVGSSLSTGISKLDTNFDPSNFLNTKTFGQSPSNITLTFNYTIGSGETSGDLDYESTSSLALNSGTIKDAAGNAATLTLASPGASNSLGNNKALIVDTTVPTVTNVTSTTSDCLLYTSDAADE